MKVMRWFLVALSATAISSQCASRAQAGTFKMDFGTLQNVNEDGERVDIPG